MRAVVCESFGGPGVASVRQWPDPVASKGKVVVRVHATSVSAGDSRIRRRDMPRGFALPMRLIFGWSRPRQPILGADFAGVVEAVGADVSGFAVGDRVMGSTGMGLGCHAERIAIPASGAIAPMPPGWSFAEAAAVIFGGGTALHFLMPPGRVAAGERVLVNGASGAVGLAAVQVAKHLGAHVTAVCSPRNAGLVASLGADEVLDYTAGDVLAGAGRWDVVLDAVGTMPFARVAPVLRPKGRLLLVVAGLPEMLKAPFQSLRSGFKVTVGTAPDSAAAIRSLVAICTAGAIRAVIDGRYPLDRVAEAHARVDSGRKVGSVILEPFGPG